MRALLLLFAVLPFPALLAQQVEVKRYDVDQGLPQSMVNHVVQDRDGFIWLGTGDGLARSDGQRMVVYKHDRRDSTSISHNTIWGLAEQDPTHLWVGTRGGLDLLDTRTGRFDHVRTDGSSDGCWVPIRVHGDSAVFYSPLLRAFLIVADGRARRLTTRHIDSYGLRSSSDGRYVHLHLRRDSLLTTDLHTGVERSSIMPVRSNERVDDLIAIGDKWLVLTDHGGWLWGGGAERIDLPLDTRTLLGHIVGTKCVERSPDGTIWLGISGVGAVALNTDLSVRDHYPLLPSDQRPLNITTIAFDRQGNVWVGTDGKGVFTIAPQRIGFGRCMPGQGLVWEPPSWFTLGFAQWDATHVLVSFYQGGLALFDEHTQKLTPLVFPELGHSATVGENRMLTNDRMGRVWIKEKLVVRALDPTTTRIAYQQTDTCGLLIGRSFSGDVLLGSVCSPLRRVDGTKGKPTFSPIDAPALHDYLVGLHNMPQVLAMDHEHRFWISSEVMPLSVWSAYGQVPLLLPADPSSDPKLRMTDLADEGEALWMTSDQGLLKWRAKDLVLMEHFTVHDGLPDQFLYGLIPIGDGTWWISSNNGLCHFDPARRSFTNYTTADGLQSKEFNSRCAFRSASGRLYFGGVNGFNHFIPGARHVDTDTAQVRLIGLVAQDSVLDLRTLAAIPRIELPYGRNSLRIDLAILEFTAPDRNTYRYRIPGYVDWTTVAADHPITLTNMPGGSYVVEAAGVNGHGTISASRSVVTIHVPLPFWVSPWGYVLAGSLVVAVLAGAGFLIYRRRVKQRLLITEQQMKELRIRTRIAQDLHDDVGSGLARIAVLSRTAGTRTSRGETSAEQVHKVGEISQELMDNLRDVVWVNDPRNGELADLLLRVKDHVRDLFEPNGVSCMFTFPEPLTERTIGNAFKRNVFLILKEAANNAYKYSATKRLDLSFTLNENGFDCVLRDHGNGLSDGPAQGSGHGVTNMRQRAQDLGAVLTIVNALEGGTQVTLSGPLSCLDL